MTDVHPPSKTQRQISHSSFDKVVPSPRFQNNNEWHPQIDLFWWSFWSSWWRSLAKIVADKNADISFSSFQMQTLSHHFLSDADNAFECRHWVIIMCVKSSKPPLIQVHLFQIDPFKPSTLIANSFVQTFHPCRKFICPYLSIPLLVPILSCKHREVIYWDLKRSFVLRATSSPKLKQSYC